MTKIKLYVYRHTFCFNMVKLSMNLKILQEIMGSSDIGVTLNSNTHHDFDDIQKDMKEVCSG